MYLEAERRCERAPCWAASREDGVLQHSQEGRRLHVRDPDLVLVLGQLSVKHGVEDGAAHGQDVLTEDRGQWTEETRLRAGDRRGPLTLTGFGRFTLCPGTLCVPPAGPTTKWTSAIISLLNMTEFLQRQDIRVNSTRARGGRGQRSGVNLRTDRSRMVGKRPCQERPPPLLLLLARFCCWYRWMDALLDEDELRVVVGKSFAAILVQSESQPGHGRSGTGRRG